MKLRRVELVSEQRHVEGGGVQQLERAPERAGGEDDRQLVLDALAGDGGDLRRAGANRIHRHIIDGEAEGDGEAHRAQQPQRIVVEVFRADHAHDEPRDVLRAAVGVAQLARGQIDGDRVDGEVAPAERRQRGEIVDGVAVDDAPRDQVAATELDDFAPQALRHAEGIVAFDVDIVRLAAEQEVADGAADAEAGAGREVTEAGEAANQFVEQHQT